MWFLYAPIVQKNGGKRPFLTAIFSVVFGMPLLCGFGQMAAKSRRKPCQPKLAKPCSARPARLSLRSVRQQSQPP
jgi:hypothetical protein